ncbi:methyltransferase, FkbM family [Mariprofundus aestuarium]|uniref:Methyltransferase, FkbM family n=1 Tax=Mariprofundus aestuarium TaxID=1921086 RepID=A0A2K8KXQ7_MARES|nr:FkbM family methyltransferase [Mariprofundus aestuarium]ATX78639.1 methyltransferase, FkbM family [Mariprofundus aestuarium]
MQLPDREEAIALLHELVRTPPVVTPRAVDRPLVLYGAGNLGKMAKAYFDRIGVPVSMVVDANAAAHRSDPCWQGVRLLAIDDVPKQVRQEAILAICIATSAYMPIAAGLKRKGWTDITPVYDIIEAYRDRHPLGNGWFTGSLDGDAASIGKVLGLWHDDRSRAHHLQFIAWHALRQEWHFNGAEVTTEDRYFIPELLALMHSSERLVDVGAHLGEVTQQFVSHVKGRYRKVTMIEADADNHGACLTVAAQYPDMSVLHCAVGATAGRAEFFSGLGYASQLDPRGGDMMDVKTLDTLCSDPVTYLKLHLEGGELAALQGALQVISTHRPLIAATAYHNRLGLWKLPMWFFENLERYRVLFRLHAWCGTGAVIYALPEERFHKE